MAEGGSTAPGVAAPWRLRRAAPGIGTAELVRKLLHVAGCAPALLLRWLDAPGAVACALAVLLFNVSVLPRLGGRRLWRDGEASRGRSEAMVLYPLAVLLLVVVFHRRLEVAAAVWAVLALGDGTATLAGKLVGGPRLPWNPGKTWAGTIAYAAFGSAGAVALLTWTAPGRYSSGYALAAGILVALAAAALESYPLGLDDNLSVPPLAGLLLFCLLLGAGRWQPWLAATGPAHLATACAVNAAFAALAWRIRGLDLPGALAGWVVGALVWAGLGWRGWLLLAAFFAIGTACTRLGLARKQRLGLAQEHGGRRSVRHVVANGAVAALAALFAAGTGYGLAFTLAAAGALAAAAADTAGSEIGQLLGRRAYMVTTLREVPRGTDGAVSPAGTLAGAAAAASLAAVGAAGGLYGWGPAAAVTLAGVLGSLADSLLGATAERDGLLDNEAVNLGNTLAGALAAAGLWLAWSGLAAG